MPIYEYECRHCGHTLEAFQKMSDANLTECPECKQTSLSKLISPAGFRLKGTGWYVTDFRDKGKSPEPNKGKTDSSNEGSKTTDNKVVTENKTTTENSSTENKPKENKAKDDKSSSTSGTTT